MHDAASRDLERFALTGFVVIALLVAGACARGNAPDATHVAVASHGSAPASATTCSDPRQWQVRDSAIGPIRIGAAAESVLHVCPGTLDSIVRERSMDQIDTVRTLFVPVGGRDTVRVVIEPVEQRVDVIFVRTAPFRTADSLAVGSPIARWRRIPGVRVIYGEDSDEGALLIPGHCGLIFGISGGGTKPESLTADARALATWPDTVRITELIVSACSPH